MNITLMAHDKKKELMVQFCTAYKSILSKHSLSATAATGRLVAEATNLPVALFLSKNQGGHQQVDARIAYNEIDLVIMFSDPNDTDPWEDQRIMRTLRRYLDTDLTGSDLAAVLWYRDKVSGNHRTDRIDIPVIDRITDRIFIIINILRPLQNIHGFCPLQYREDIIKHFLPHLFRKKQLSLIIRIHTARCHNSVKSDIKDRCFGYHDTAASCTDKCQMPVFTDFCDCPDRTLWNILSLFK